MAKRRDLKEYVNFIMEHLHFYCEVCSYLPEVDKVKIQELMDEIPGIRTEFISRINHTEPGNVKNFYKKFHADLRDKVKEISDRADSLIGKAE